VCEAYPGISPLDIEEMSLDQLYTLFFKAEFLKGDSVKAVSPGLVMHDRILTEEQLGGPQQESVFQQVKKRNAALKAGLPIPGESKREWRRRRRQQWALTIAAEREGGEV
jgi:hypothetical protein